VNDHDPQAGETRRVLIGLGFAAYGSLGVFAAIQATLRQLPLNQASPSSLFAIIGFTPVLFGLGCFLLIGLGLLIYMNINAGKSWIIAASWVTVAAFGLGLASRLAIDLRNLQFVHDSHWVFMVNHIVGTLGFFVFAVLTILPLLLLHHFARQLNTA